MTLLLAWLRHELRVRWRALAALALAAAAHAITVTVRRREIAIMRALGLTPAQSRVAVLRPSAPSAG